LLETASGAGLSSAPRRMLPGQWGIDRLTSETGHFLLAMPQRSGICRNRGHPLSVGYTMTDLLMRNWQKHSSSGPARPGPAAPLRWERPGVPRRDPHAHGRMVPSARGVSAMSTANDAGRLEKTAKVRRSWRRILAVLRSRIKMWTEANPVGGVRQRGSLYFYRPIRHASALSRAKQSTRFLLGPGPGHRDPGAPLKKIAALVRKRSRAAPRQPPRFDGRPADRVRQVTGWLRQPLVGATSMPVQRATRYKARKA